MPELLNPFLPDYDQLQDPFFLIPSLIPNPHNAGGLPGGGDRLFVRSVDIHSEQLDSLLKRTFSIGCQCYKGSTVISGPLDPDDVGFPMFIPLVMPTWPAGLTAAERDEYSQTIDELVGTMRGQLEKWGERNSKSKNTLGEECTEPCLSVHSAALLSVVVVFFIDAVAVTATFLFHVEVDVDAYNSVFYNRLQAAASSAPLLASLDRAPAGTSISSLIGQVLNRSSKLTLIRLGSKSKSPRANASSDSRAPRSVRTPLAIAARLQLMQADSEGVLRMPGGAPRTLGLNTALAHCAGDCAKPQ